VADDDRMFYGEAVTPSKKYTVEAIDAGKSNARYVTNSRSRIRFGLEKVITRFVDCELRIHRVDKLVE
jgi:hypothetical protein